MYIIMNFMSTLEIRGAHLSFTRNRSPSRSEVQSQGEHPNLAWLDPATKSDEYLNLMRTVAIPDYRSPPGNKGAHALRRIEGDTAHFLMVTFWES